MFAMSCFDLEELGPSPPETRCSQHPVQSPSSTTHQETTWQPLSEHGRGESYEREDEIFKLETAPQKLSTLSCSGCRFPAACWRVELLGFAVILSTSSVHFTVCCRCLRVSAASGADLFSCWNNSSSLQRNHCCKNTVVPQATSDFVWSGCHCMTASRILVH